MTWTNFIKRKVYPKEGTRVRIPGMYHITTWHCAVRKFSLHPGEIICEPLAFGSPKYRNLMIIS